VRRERRPGAVGGLALALAFASVAAAGATELTFDSTNQGVQTVELDEDGLTHNTMPAAFAGSGGNPGGYVSFDDPDSGPLERYGVFVVPSELGPADYGADVTFDLRSSAADLHPNRLGSVTFSFGGFGAGVICVLSAPTAAWAGYGTTIGADEPCWKRTLGGQDASRGDIENALEASGESYVNADFGTGADEVTDLDNFVVDAPEPRWISLRYRPEAKTFAGKVTSGAAECTSGVEVELYLKGGEVPLESGETNPNGRFSIARKAKRDRRYYALAPLFAGETESCAEAESRRVKG
jgi:hypothetical protein